MDFEKEVDARGLNCPLPILRAKKALADMQPNQVLRVVATDPGAVKDFQALPSRPAMNCCNMARRRTRPLNSF